MLFSIKQQNIAAFSNTDMLTSAVQLQKKVCILEIMICTTVTYLGTLQLPKYWIHICKSLVKIFSPNTLMVHRKQMDKMMNLCGNRVWHVSRNSWFLRNDIIHRWGTWILDNPRLVLSCKKNGFKKEQCNSPLSLSQSRDFYSSQLKQSQFDTSDKVTLLLLGWQVLFKCYRNNRGL
jgi:hypothetical protein